MPIALQELVDEIRPDQTVVILGAGASMPSGAPSAADLIATIAESFKIDAEGLNLREISGLAENRRNRRDVITAIRAKFRGLKPKGAILNFPLYGWRSIFTTNYDNLVELAYERAGRPIKALSSNFDFTVGEEPGATKLFKLHGTIEKDTIDGNVSKLILTDFDYDATEDYREALYDRMRVDLSAGTQVVIIGQSLADEDLREIVQRAIAINQKAQNAGRISLLLYQADQNRAQLLEMRGLRVAFGGLDEFFAAMSKKTPDHTPLASESGDPLDVVTNLRPVTRDISEEIDPSNADVSAMFNGRPANYADIVRGFTFERNVVTDLLDFFSQPQRMAAILLGASGVGKTTAIRQALVRLRGQGFHGYEHKSDHSLAPKAWLAVAEALTEKKLKGVLFVDDGHLHLYEINELVDLMTARDCSSLKVIIASTRGHWGPRIKSPNLYTYGKEFFLSQLHPKEIDRLLNLVDSVQEMRALVDQGFGGFSRYEKRRRLVDRCEADMFVCMRNIFASEKYDDIILREYGELSGPLQDVYRWIAAMEHAGIRVHRQLVMRILGIDANSIASILANLVDIIGEYDVSAEEGIYAWRVRHYVIAGIISKYKFHEVEKLIDLFTKVIDSISPTFEIEILTIRQLCNIESGLSVIPDKLVQNKLLRKMMSVAPGERVPRHRLIRNLIDLGEFEKAESEIRIFEHDFSREAPIARYRLLLMIARAVTTPGLMKEDRLVILDKARELATSLVSRYSGNKYVLGAFCELGVESFKLTASLEVFDIAMSSLKAAENRLGDPDITRLIGRYQRRISGYPVAKDDPDAIIESDI